MKLFILAVYAAVIIVAVVRLNVWYRNEKLTQAERDQEDNEIGIW